MSQEPMVSLSLSQMQELEQRVTEADQRAEGAEKQVERRSSACEKHFLYRTLQAFNRLCHMFLIEHLTA